MYSLKNTTKCTFVGSGFIEILDFEDKEFYTFENLEMRKMRGISKRYVDMQNENGVVVELETLN